MPLLILRLLLFGIATSFSRHIWYRVHVRAIGGVVLIFVLDGVLELFLLLFQQSEQILLELSDSFINVLISVYDWDLLLILQFLNEQPHAWLDAFGEVFSIAHLERVSLLLLFMVLDYLFLQGLDFDGELLLAFARELVLVFSGLGF